MGQSPDALQEVLDSLAAIGEQVRAAICALARENGCDRPASALTAAAYREVAQLRALATGGPRGEDFPAVRALADAHLEQLDGLLTVATCRAAQDCALIADRLAHREEWIADVSLRTPSACSVAALSRALSRA